MWNRIFLGCVGLFLAFSAGGKLQSWFDEGTVWHHRKGYEPRLLAQEQESFLYGFEIAMLVLAMLFGLGLVWVALGGSLKKKS